MDKQYWHQRWQFNEIGFNQPKPNPLLQRFFPQLILKPQAHVFVPLCGKSLDMLWLANQGYKVTGVELSQVACQSFFNEHNIPVTITETNDFLVFASDDIKLLCGDFFKLGKASLDPIDAVYDRAALIALPSELRKLYSKQLASLLDPDTKILLITTSYNQNEMQGPPFSIDENEIQTLFKLNFDINQLYSKSLNEIPGHLKVKGLMQATEQVYLLSKMDLQAS